MYNIYFIMYNIYIYIPKWPSVGGGFASASAAARQRVPKTRAAKTTLKDQPLGPPRFQRSRGFNGEYLWGTNQNIEKARKNIQKYRKMVEIIDILEIWETPSLSKKKMEESAGSGIKSWQPGARWTSRISGWWKIIWKWCVPSLW